MPGIYLHVPFCIHKCVYCDFYSIESGILIDKFVDACEREIQLRAGSIGPDGSVFSTVYFGGGTPSLLDPRAIGGLLDTLAKHLVISGDAEISMECNPGTVNAGRLAGYRAAGINRLSIGVQSFDDADLRFLGRIHSAGDARATVELARESGFENTSLDLMFAIPRQSMQTWLRNLEISVDLGVPHLSCYSLTVEPSTPLGKMVESDPGLLPSKETDGEMYEHTMSYLEAAGYRHYEVSNYSRPGFECRHHQGYWTQEDYIGIGPSACGTWKSLRTWNVCDVEAYIAMLSDGRIPAGRSEAIDEPMRLREHVFLALRSEGLSMDTLQSRFGMDLMKEKGGIINAMLQAGYLSMRSRAISLTRKGFVLCDEVCQRLMP
jgi:oxygen-independent coproporphyrinogen-3 oxidase